MREHRSRHDYDLFESSIEFTSAQQFDGEGGLLSELAEPGMARRIAPLSTIADEGAPAVAPAGDFLYFASDRAGSLGGFDLFRTRLTRTGFGPVENLGPAINSSADDMDPALSADGFRLFFSTNRSTTEPHLYQLYGSVSREVYIDHDAVNTSGFTDLLSGLWPWLLLLLLLAMLFYLLSRLLRDAAWRKRFGQLGLLAQCLLLSLALHMLIAGALALWRVGNEISDYIAQSGGARVILASTGPASDAAAQIRGAFISDDLASSLTIDPPALDPSPSFAAGAEPAVASIQTPEPEQAPVPESSDTRVTIDPSPIMQRSVHEVSTSQAASDPFAPRVIPTLISASLPIASSPEAPTREPSAAVFQSEDEHAVSARFEIGSIPAQSPAILTKSPAIPTTPSAGVPINDRGGAPPRTSTLLTKDDTRIDSPSLAPEPISTNVALPGAIDPSLPMAAEPTLEPREPAATGPSTQPLLIDLAATRANGLVITSARPTDNGARSARSSIAVQISTETPVSSSPTSNTTRPIDLNASALASPTKHARYAVPVPSSVVTDAAEPSLEASSDEAMRRSTEPSSLPPAPIVFVNESSIGVAANAPTDRLLPSVSVVKPSVVATAIPSIAPDSNPSGSTASGLNLPEGLAYALAAAPAAANAARLPPEEAPVQPKETFEQRDPEVRAEVLEQMGGSKQTEKAVGMALDWFITHQHPDGRWSGKQFDDRCGKCTDPAEFESDGAMTGIVLLCFLGAGHTPIGDSPYQANVARAIDWLVARQEPTGDLRRGETMYSQTVGTVALCEALAMTRDPKLIVPTRRAVAFLESNWQSRVRRARSGDLDSKADADNTSVLGWQVMAMESARRAGIEVSGATFDAARAWLDYVADASRPGRYSYRRGEAPSPAMTAEAMFVRQLLVSTEDTRAMQQSAEFILQTLPRWRGQAVDRDARASDTGDAQTYYWYYATLALFQHQGDAWKHWNEALVPALLENQHQTGPAAGSWDPQDPWSRLGGRVYQTAICTLSLEVYYRYKPAGVQRR